MAMAQPELLRRADEYANRNGLIIREKLGFGVHGIVLTVENQAKGSESAIKVHERETDYQRERDIYIRLGLNAVTHIRGCAVPDLISFDDALWVLEMTVVSRPFVLDFAVAFLDRAPDFSDEVMAEWHAEKIEQIGDRWPEAQAILGVLRSYGIHMIDVNPGNISFG